MKNTTNNFIAGKTKENLSIWKTITSDEWILNTIKGCRVELTEKPKQKFVPTPLKFSNEEADKIQKELNRFLLNRIIEPAMEDTQDEFISNIFIRPKKDGRVRIILNLKLFNEKYVDKFHFKMETLRSAIQAIRKNGYMASIDISDAYYSVNIHESDRKYFRFWFNGVKYQFTALVMGYSCSPRIWTKLMKPVFAYLRSKGHTSVYFIDDSWLFGDTFHSCLTNVRDSVSLMDNLGLTINLSKSVTLPCTNIVFLGFILCSKTLTIRLTPEKKDDIVSLCKNMLCTKRTTIRCFAKMIGKLNAAEPGVQHATLHIRPLEKVKEHNLKIHRGNFDKFMNVPKTVHASLQWWITSVKSSYKNVLLENPGVIIYTDASQKMYGAYNETHKIKTSGFWSLSEQKLHINELELRACELGVLAFCNNFTNVHIKIYTDNTTSCSYINKYGGKIESLDIIARRLWFWCMDRNIYLSASHVAGVSNTEADRLSRMGNDDIEWALDPNIFSEIFKIFPTMTIDLFASRLNAKLSLYVSRYPDANACAVDAFSFKWVDKLFYIFAPFSLLGRILQKIEQDETQAIIIAPVWPAQAWWPTLTNLIRGPCFLLPKTKEILRLEHKPTLTYPLTKTRLIVFNISGRRYESRAYQMKLKNSSSSLGEEAPGNNITRILKNGFITAIGKQIPLNPIYRL